MPGLPDIEPRAMLSPTLNSSAINSGRSPIARPTRPSIVITLALKWTSGNRSRRRQHECTVSALVGRSQSKPDASDVAELRQPQNHRYIERNGARSGCVNARDGYHAVRNVLEPFALVVACSSPE